MIYDLTSNGQIIIIHITKHTLTLIQIIPHIIIDQQQKPPRVLNSVTNPLGLHLIHSNLTKYITHKYLANTSKQYSNTYPIETT
jgi:hypothetical protein